MKAMEAPRLAEEGEGERRGVLEACRGAGEGGGGEGEAAHSLRAAVVVVARVPDGSSLCTEEWKQNSGRILKGKIVVGTN